jgi:hypothetical protein
MIIKIKTATLTANSEFLSKAMWPTLGQVSIPIPLAVVRSDVGDMMQSSYWS